MSVTSTAIPALILHQKLGPCPCPGAGSGEAGPLAALPLFKLTSSKLQHVRCVKNSLFFPIEKLGQRSKFQQHMRLKKIQFVIIIHQQLQFIEPTVQNPRHLKAIRKQQFHR